MSTQSYRPTVPKRKIAVPETPSAEKNIGLEVAVARETSVLAMSIRASAATNLTGKVLILFAVTIFVFAMFMLMKTNHYFAVTPSGQMTPLKSLDSPAEQSGAVEGFLERALADSMTFGHINYREHLIESYGRYFTENGAKSHSLAMINIQLKKFMAEEYSFKLIVEAKGPKIVSEGKDGGQYYYVADTPVRMVFDPAGNGPEGEEVINRWVVRTVVFVSNTDTGFSINQFVVAVGR
jgi:hypothetical protein